jgi:hypothetical protein
LADPENQLDTARNIAAIDREKYKHNGSWEARRTAYTEIVAALTALAKSASFIDYHMNGEEAEAERYYASEQFNKHSQAMRGRSIVPLTRFTTAIY